MLCIVREKKNLFLLSILFALLGYMLFHVDDLGVSLRWSFTTINCFMHISFVLFCAFMFCAKNYLREMPLNESERFSVIASELPVNSKAPFIS